jgi:long-chain fatty acid transport protein
MKTTTRVVLLSLASSTALAGGFQIDEQDAAAIGRAGTAGARQGPSSLYYNPAGLFDERTEVSAELGATAIIPGASALPPDGVRQSASSQVFLPPYVYGSYRLNDRVAFGAGFNAPFGLGVTWGQDFEDRFELQKAAFQTFAFMAGAAVRVVPPLTLGLTVGLARTSVAVQQKLDFVTQEGTADLQTAGWGVLLGAGVQYEPVKRVRLGFSFSLPTETSLKGTARFTNVPDSFGPLTNDQDVTSKVTLPARFRLAVSALATEQIRVDVDIAYTLWSSFKQLNFDFADPLTPDKSLEKDWKNTFTVRVGGEYDLPKLATLRAGLLFDQAAVPPSTLGPDLPDGNRYGLSLGLGRELVKGLRADLSYAFILIDGQKSTLANFPAAYDGHAHAIGLALTYKLPSPAAPPLADSDEAGPGGLK